MPVSPANGNAAFAAEVSFLPNQESNQAHGLRVGLTGGLGSGKSTVAAMLATHGATVLSADELARSLMQPGQPVFAAIVEHLGHEVVREDGTLDRAALARLAFTGGRIDELNAIIHPATIALQAERVAKVFAQQPNAIVVVESALIFETKYGDAEAQPEPAPQAAAWATRFDRLILVTAPEALKVNRFVARSGASDPAARAELAAEARRRLARMIPDERKAPLCDFILANDATLDYLQQQVDTMWRLLTGKR